MINPSELRNGQIFETPLAGGSKLFARLFIGDQRGYLIILNDVESSWYAGTALDLHYATVRADGLSLQQASTIFEDLSKWTRCPDLEQGLEYLLTRREELKNRPKEFAIGARVRIKPREAGQEDQTPAYTDLMLRHAGTITTIDAKDRPDAPWWILKPLEGDETLGGYRFAWHEDWLELL